MSTIAIQNGQIVGTPIGKHGSIPITAMGEGIPHLLALINDLCLAENKLFLIEEPENDIHPKRVGTILPVEFRIYVVAFVELPFTRFCSLYPLGTKGLGVFVLSYGAETAHQDGTERACSPRKRRLALPLLPPGSVRALLMPCPH